MKIQTFKSDNLIIKTSIYGKIGDSEVLLASSICSIISDDMSVSMIKDLLRNRLNVNKNDQRFIKEILYYNGNIVGDSYEIKKKIFDVIEYEIYLKNPF